MSVALMSSPGLPGSAGSSRRPSLGSSKGPKCTDPLMVQAGLGEGGVQVEPHGLVQGLGLA